MISTIFPPTNRNNTIPIIFFFVLFDIINNFQKQNGLKITEVTSPTFNLLNEYQIKQIKINHYDLFRIKNSSEIKDLDIFEKNEKIITIVEWPQLIKNNNNY